MTTQARLTVGPRLALSAVNTDLLTGVVNGWFDAKDFNSASVTIMTTAGISAGVVSFEGTDDLTNDASGSAVFAYDASLITAPPVSSLTLAASTIKRYTVRLPKRYFRARISTAVVGGTVGLTATFNDVDRNHSALVAPAGITASASFTPAAAAYSAGDIMDVAKEFAFTYADGSPLRAGSLIRILTAIVKIDQTAMQASEAAYALQCFSETPPSALADNAAWTLASADLTAYRGAIQLGTPIDLGAACYVKTPNIDLDIKLATSSLWGQCQTIAGFTATAVARQVLLYGVEL